ncbi:MAG: hypothetical protein ACJAVI_001958 [Candidatus Azotimanducaceae bacterium]|jgi:hypothetical protein
MKKNYLLLLVPSFPFGRWITGAILFVGLFLFFKLTSTVPMTAVVLFSTIIISYIIPIFSFITEKSTEALDDLKDELELTDEAFIRVKTSITQTTLLGNLIPPAVGLLLALLHQSLIFGSTLNLSLSDTRSAENFASFVGTILIWITMTTVIYALTSNARTFSKLAKNHVKIDLFQISKLLPFARVAIISTLALIGALTLFPILFFDSSTPLSGSLPGFFATGVPIIIMLALPIWPIHQRLILAKRQVLTDVKQLINEATEKSPTQSFSKQTIENIAPLLNYQSHLSQLSTWPFDLSAVTRLLLYLVIPPLTWLGAALIEKGLDSVL